LRAEDLCTVGPTAEQAGRTRKQMVLDTVGRPAKTTVESQLSATVSEGDF